ncbi:MAG: hypothetical protein AB7U20_04610 [Planctomycetaceae bacterium]
MARCLCCSAGLLCVWVIAVSGSDTPQIVDREAPVPIKRYVPKHYLPPQPTPIVAAAAMAAPAAVPHPLREQDSLTPVQHLRRAAEHLEAAAVGPSAEELCEQAAELRQTADRLEQETAARLANLKQQLAGIQAEIDKLEQLSPQSAQVQVSIKMIEVDTAIVEKLGLTLHAATDPQTNLIERLVSAKNGNGQTLPAVVPCESAELFVEALRKIGAARVLSSPQIITMSGRPATMNVGGEFPVPLPQQAGGDTVEWRPFGIRAEIVPQVLENGRLKLDLASEVSERDFSKGVNIGNHLVPGLTTRRINTQVEMEFGQTLAVGGLTSRANGPAEGNQGAAVIYGAPVPGQDRVFQRVAHEEQSPEKTLIVLVTPKRVPRWDQ